MENPISHALRTIMDEIPIEILELTYKNEERRMSLDSCIHEDTIIKRVLHDCNIVAGRMKTIVLDPTWVKPANLPVGYMVPDSRSYSIYTIPPEARENRPISAVISIRYPYSLYVGSQLPTGAYPGGKSSTTLGSLGCNVLNSQTWGNESVMPIPILISGHQVKLTPITTIMTMNYTWELTCRLSYDSEFTNLNSDAILQLTDLILAATKIHIFNTLVLKADKFYTTAGQEWGRMREIVDSYADEKTRYRELLSEFQGSGTTLDPESMFQLVLDSL